MASERNAAIAALVAIPLCCGGLAWIGGFAGLAAMAIWQGWLFVALAAFIGAVAFVWRRTA